MPLSVAAKPRVWYFGISASGGNRIHSLFQAYRQLRSFGTLLSTSNVYQPRAVFDDDEQERLLACVAVMSRQPLDDFLERLAPTLHSCHQALGESAITPLCTTTGAIIDNSSASSRSPSLSETLSRAMGSVGNSTTPPVSHDFKFVPLSSPEFADRGGLFLSALRQLHRSLPTPVLACMTEAEFNNTTNAIYTHQSAQFAEQAIDMIPSLYQAVRKYTDVPRPKPLFGNYMLCGPFTVEINTGAVGGGASVPADDPDVFALPFPMMREAHLDLRYVTPHEAHVAAASARISDPIRDRDASRPPAQQAAPAVPRATPPPADSVAGGGGESGKYVPYALRRANAAAAAQTPAGAAAPLAPSAPTAAGGAVSNLVNLVGFDGRAWRSHVSGTCIDAVGPRTFVVIAPEANDPDALDHFDVVSAHLLWLNAIACIPSWLVGIPSSVRAATALTSDLQTIDARPIAALPRPPGAPAVVPDPRPDRQPGQPVDVWMTAE